MYKLEANLQKLVILIDYNKSLKTVIFNIIILKVNFIYKSLLS